MLYRTRRTLREPETWRIVVLVAKALMEQGVLTDEQIQALIHAPRLDTKNERE